jgi:hypothetical protein
MVEPILDANGNPITGNEGEPQVPIEEQPPDYGGFETLEALTEEFNRVKTEADELKSLKGRMGNELGELRSEKEKLQSYIDGIESARTEPTPDTQPRMTLDDIDREYQEGNISLAKALESVKNITESSMESKLASTKEEILSDLARERYSEQFMTDFPDYKELFDTGKLNADMGRGFNPEAAYFAYKGREEAAKNHELQEQIKTLTTNAQNAGVQQGVKLEQGKNAAGKVLDGEGGSGSFSQSAGTPPKYTNTAERLRAGVELAKKLGAFQ